jgi:aldose 1-epimerase
MASEGLLRLTAGRFELLLAPTAGGAIARYDWIEGKQRAPILRGCEGIPKTALETANFPLVPFVNRVRGGAFTFRGREIALSPNMPGDPSPLHGQGWLAPWTVESAREGEAELLFRHEPGEWPWAYEARQIFQLDGDGLSLALVCRNLSDGPMPCGLGQHPYFPCTAETRLDTEVTHVWTIDEQVLPVEKVPAAGRYGLQNRLVCGQCLDHGFGGWSGSAAMNTPGAPFEIRLSCPQARFFQLYSPIEGGLYVAEPVTHANAAMNAPEAEWPELGLQVLQPGEEMRLDMRLDTTSVTLSQ